MPSLCCKVRLTNRQCVRARHAIRPVCNCGPHARVDTLPEKGRLRSKACRRAESALLVQSHPVDSDAGPRRIVREAHVFACEQSRL